MKSLKEYYREMYQKPYSEKEPWEKFLDKERIQRKRREKEIRTHEILYDPTNLDRFTY